MDLRRIHQLSCLHDARLHHRDEAGAIFKQADVANHVAIHHQDVRQFPHLKSSQLVIAPQDRGPRVCRALDYFAGSQSDMLNEESELASVIAMWVPGKAVVASHPQPPTSAEDASRASAPPSRVSL